MQIRQIIFAWLKRNVYQSNVSPSFLSAESMFLI